MSLTAPISLPGWDQMTPEQRQATFMQPQVQPGMVMQDQTNAPGHAGWDGHTGGINWGSIAGPQGSAGQYDPQLKAWMDDVFAKATNGQRMPRPDEYDQWIGPNGYVNKETDAERGLTPGAPAPYWAQRMTLHAQGDYNGDNPAYDASIGGGQTLGQMGGFSNQPQNGVASFNAPGLLAPYTKEFAPTDINTILQAPAFQAAQANGIDELGRSAAARGTLLTGGFGKDLMKYSMGLSLGELNNQFNRDATTYGTNRDTFYGNQNNAFNKLSSFAGTGQNLAQTLNATGTGYANNAQQNATTAGGLVTGQGVNDANNSLAKGVNTGQTVGNAINNVADWASLFKKPAASMPQRTT